MTTYAELAEQIGQLAPRLGAVRLIAVDGPSGSGKTHFAGRLAKHLDAPIVHTDDLLDGWDDQFTFWPRLEELVLGPLSAGRKAVYQRYLWHRGEFGGIEVTVEPAPCVLLEGVSSARREVRSRLSLSVFLTAPAELRRQRVIDRDRSDDVAFRSYLERWRAAEDRHFAADGTRAAADLVVDGAADCTDDSYQLLEQRERGS